MTARLIVACALLGAACAPPPCANVGAVTSEGELFPGDDVALGGGFVEDGTATLRFAGGDGEAFIQFPAIEPLLVPQEAVEVEVIERNCYGEGCDPALWVVSQAGDSFIEVGTVNVLDGRSNVNGTAARLSVVEGAVCEDDDDGGPASLEVSADDGTRTLAPGESELVTIDGATWRLIAVAAARHDYFELLNNPDGSGVGPHSDLFATGVLYRIEE